MRIILDRDICIGASNCVAVAPTVFALDKTNKVILLDPSTETDDVILEAAESCPTDAIILRDDDGYIIYPKCKS